MLTHEGPPSSPDRIQSSYLSNGPINVDGLVHPPTFNGDPILEGYLRAPQTNVSREEEMKRLQAEFIANGGEVRTDYYAVFAVGNLATRYSGEVEDPLESARKRLMDILPPESKQTIEVFGDDEVRSFIENVQRTREDNPTISDWDISLNIRRAVEVEQPDLALLERAKLATLLLEGRREEAHFIF